MTTLYFVRHGVTEYNTTLRLQGASDIPLNNEGQSQAEGARDYFKNIHIDKILSSPLSRAFETAEIINTEHQLPIELLDDLKEQAFGSFEGEHIENIRLKYPEGDLPGSETPEELTARAKAVIEYITQHYKAQNILITAHSRIIKAILSLFSDDIHLVFTKLDNCSVSILKSDGEGYSLKEINISTQ